MKKKRYDREIIYLEIEASKINREKAKIVLNKSLTLYVVFMVVGIFGFTFGYMSRLSLNLLILTGVIIIILGAIPYLVVTEKEEKKIKKLIEELKNE